jgi:hypothetical protein
MAMTAGVSFRMTINCSARPSNFPAQKTKALVRAPNCDAQVTRAYGSNTLSTTKGSRVRHLAPNSQMHQNGAFYGGDIRG